MLYYYSIKIKSSSKECCQGSLWVTSDKNMSECQRIQATHISQSATNICFYRSKPKFVKSEILYFLFPSSVKALCMLGKHSTSEQHPQYLAIGIRSLLFGQGYS